jgi:hypothetical protein
MRRALAEDQPVRLTRQREHEIDRMVAAAVWHRQKAQRKPYRFEIPKKARKAC